MCQLSVYVHHMNPLQSAVQPEALLYIHLTLLVYCPEQICLSHQICMYNCTIRHQYICMSTAINNVIRSTGIATFHITGICLSNYACLIAHIFPLHFYCSLHKDLTLLHISIKINNLQHLLSYYCKMCISNRYVPQMPLISPIPKLLNMHLWGEHTNIPVQYKVAPINDIARITVHRQGWWRNSFQQPGPVQRHQYSTPTSHTPNTSPWQLNENSKYINEHPCILLKTIRTVTYNSAFQDHTQMYLSQHFLESD